MKLFRNERKCSLLGLVSDQEMMWVETSLYLTQLHQAFASHVRKAWKQQVDLN